MEVKRPGAIETRPEAIELSPSGLNSIPNTAAIELFGSALACVGLVRPKPPSPSGRANSSCVSRHATDIRRTVTRIAMWCTTADVIANMFLQTRSFRNVYVSLTWLILCLYTALSYEVWLRITSQDNRWKSLLQDAAWADERAFTRRMSRLTKFGIGMYIVMVGLTVIGTIIPTWQGAVNDPPDGGWTTVLYVRLVVRIAFVLPWALAFVADLVLLDFVITCQEINAKMVARSTKTTVIRGIDVTAAEVAAEDSQVQEPVVTLSIMADQPHSPLDSSPRTPDTPELSNGIERLTTRNNSPRSPDTPELSNGIERLTPRNNRAGHRFTTPSMNRAPQTAIGTIDFWVVWAKVSTHVKNDQGISVHLSGVVVARALLCLALTVCGGRMLYSRWTTGVDDRASVHYGAPSGSSDLFPHYYEDWTFLIVGFVTPIWFLWRMGRVSSKWDDMSRFDTYTKCVPGNISCVHPQWFRDLSTLLHTLDTVPHGYYVYLFRVSSFRAHVAWVLYGALSIVLIVLR